MKTLSQILRLLLLTNLMATAQAQVVSIPDPGLNAAIRYALQMPVAPLTAQDMLSLTYLDVSSGYYYVTSVEGLGAAHNLTSLDFAFDGLTNLTLPQGLTNLVVLSFGGSSLTNLGLPAEMANLALLDPSTGLNEFDPYHHNNLSDFSLRVGMTSLTNLNLLNN